MDAMLYLAKWLMAVSIASLVVVLVFRLLLPSRKVEPPSGSSYMGTSQTWAMISGTIVMICVFGAVLVFLAQCVGVMDVPSNLGYSYP